VSLLSDLQAKLAGYDDDALAALASKGLVRRAYKDLENQPHEVVEEGDDAVTVAAGQQRVRFDAGGPARAICSCPAAGTCRHILSAMLYLQRPTGGGPSAAPSGPADESAVPGEPAASPAPGPPALDTLGAELLALDHAALAKHAGKTAYRWAWQFVNDLDLQEAVTIGGDRNVVIGFARPRLTFRYPGGGIDQMIVDSPIPNAAKYRVAAVLAYQMAHGVVPAKPEAPKSRAQKLDLGKDHAQLPPSAEAVRDSRERLRAAVRQLAAESVELGLSHLSEGIHQRYSTLAVWAQGAGYHRLALLIRRLADHVELLLERSGGADEHRLLTELSMAFALATALEEAARRGDEPAHLAGRSRTVYEEVGTLELLGLGAHSWRSASGYVGLTMIFWSPVHKAFYSCTDARPEALRGFDPIARYKAPGPWGGLGAPEQATGKLVTLTGTLMNSAGRLSAAEGVSASVRAVPSDFRIADLLDPVGNWAEVAQLRRFARRSLLSEPQPLKDWFALRPTALGPARFDSASQTFTCRALDDAGESIGLELPFSEHTEHAIARLEELAKEPLPEWTLIIAKVQGSGGSMTAEPLGLVHRNAADGRHVDSLHFDKAAKKGAVARLLSKKHAISIPVVTQEPVPVMPETVTELRSWLRRQAERGVAQPGAARQELGERLERAAAAGLSAFPKVRESGRTAETLLAAHYVCMQYERLVDDSVDSVAET
jgi:hypothetical protein